MLNKEDENDICEMLIFLTIRLYWNIVRCNDTKIG